MRGVGNCYTPCAVPTRRARLTTRSREFWVDAKDGDSLAYVVPTWTCRGCTPQTGPVPGRRRRRVKRRVQTNAAAEADTPESDVDERWEPELEDDVLYGGLPYVVVGRMAADGIFDLLASASSCT